MGRPRKKFADILEEHLAACPLEEAQDILAHVETLVRFRLAMSRIEDKTARPEAKQLPLGGEAEHGY